MIAVIKQGGKQYVVKEGDEIRVESIAYNPGDSVQITDVLLVDDGNGGVTVGRPLVEGASVEALVTAHGREKKLTILKRAPRKRYRKKQGHRQEYTGLKIVKIAG